MTTLAVTSANSLLCQPSTCFRIGSKFRCIRSTPIENAVDERERLRVFREHRGKVAWDNVFQIRVPWILDFPDIDFQRARLSVLQLQGCASSAQIRFQRADR